MISRNHCNHDIPTRLTQINADESAKDLSSVQSRLFARVPEATDRLIERDLHQQGSLLSVDSRLTLYDSASNVRQRSITTRNQSVLADRTVILPSRARIWSFDLSFGATRGPFVSR